MKEKIIHFQLKKSLLIKNLILTKLRVVSKTWLARVERVETSKQITNV